jgi:hypothetical protein
MEDSLRPVPTKRPYNGEGERDQEVVILIKRRDTRNIASATRRILQIWLVFQVQV